MRLCQLATATLFSLTTLTSGLRAQVPLYDNLGTLTHRISTRVPLAQRYFDQGFRLTYAFNHGEAIRAFSEAARLDSTCAICWWGVANAYGPNINLPMDSASGAAAHAAIQRALALRHHASAAEQAYIDALALRFGSNPVADRGARDSAYASAMLAVARRFPADPDAGTLAAAAQMELRPWNYWQADGSAYPGVEAFVAQLQRIIARHPSHPGACHYLIHAVEASPRPERALACARRLENAMPGAGHLVHMPGHLYLRLGMYADAQRVNVHAAHADESYIADRGPGSFYTMAYYPHNLHFLWAAAAFEGRRADADSAMRRLRAVATLDLIRQVPPLEFFNLAWYYHLVWFGRWDAILREPAPPAEFVTSHGLWRYAQGMAHASMGHVAVAQRELDSLRAIASRASRELAAGITMGFAPPSALLGIASHALAGEVASKAGRHAEAAEQLREAVRLEDALTYNEPSDWYAPMRLSLGAALLAGGDAAGAETTYREELRKHPHSGWALIGLKRALEAQGKSAEAARTQAQLRRAWSRADVGM